MVWVLVACAVVSSGSFLGYGYETLFKDPPGGEFERFGIPQVRTFVGVTQLLGAVGVMLGLGYAPLGAAAAAGLTVMMVLGLLARLKAHDAPRLMVPAGTLAVLNATLMVLFLLR